jgi:hypothetical protein
MPLAASKISAWIGTTIVDEFDLEGSAKEVNDFEALFLDQPRSSARSAKTNVVHEVTTNN